MIEVVGIRFKPVGKIYYFAPQGLALTPGMRVIVETVRGKEMGEVILGNKEVAEDDAFMPLSPVVRIATDADFATVERNHEKEKRALAICEEKIRKHKLEMTLVDAEYTFDGSKIVFNFVAEGRVDFRELVKDLASVFKTRIELRQIGVRDETKAMGALGVCGRKVCCANFLNEFAPVSVKMAKDQGLSTNPQKISGTCGKLICCLNFEEKTYEEAIKSMPRVGSVVKTPDGEGVVSEVVPLAEMLRVKFMGDQVVIKTYKKEDVVFVKGPKKDEKAEAKEENEDE